MSEANAAMSAEMEFLKKKLKATWTAGDFGEIAKAYEKDAEDFVARLALRPGERVLDVACGTGNTALPAARAGAETVGVEIAWNLLEKARRRAESENLDCRFEEGDAEDLPYEDAGFETVVSMFGAMFAPRPERVAAELLRVARPGGRIVMANWTPDGFIGQMFKITARHVAPPPNMASPLMWGDEATVRERFGAAVSEWRFERRFIAFEFPFPPASVVEHFRKFYGPTQKAFDALEADREKQDALRRELENHWRGSNLAAGDATRVESEYLEIVAHRR